MKCTMILLMKVGLCNIKLLTTISYQDNQASTTQPNQSTSTATQQVQNEVYNDTTDEGRFMQY